MNGWRSPEEREREIRETNEWERQLRADIEAQKLSKPKAGHSRQLFDATLKMAIVWMLVLMIGELVITGLGSLMKADLAVVNIAFALGSLAWFVISIVDLSIGDD